MNPGPILIIRNTFPTLLSSLLFSAIYYSENTKILSIPAITHKNPKTTLLSYISSRLHLETLFTFSFALCLIYLVIYYLHYYLFTFSYCVTLLIRNLVLDNHLVDLGTQDKVPCFTDCLTRRGRITSEASFPRVRFKLSSHPCGEKKLATTLCTWSPNKKWHDCCHHYRSFYDEG